MKAEIVFSLPLYMRIRLGMFFFYRRRWFEHTKKTSK